MEDDLTMHIPPASRKLSRRPGARLSAAACAAAVLFLLGAEVTPALAASRTTQPGVVYSVVVVLTDKAITIPEDKHLRASGDTRYPRGAIIDFVLRNRGTRPLSVVLTVTSKLHFIGAEKFSSVASAGKAIVPGHLRHFRLSFYFRGSFVLETLVRGKIQARHRITVF